MIHVQVLYPIELSIWVLVWISISPLRCMSVGMIKSGEKGSGGRNNF